MRLCFACIVALAAIALPARADQILGTPRIVGSTPGAGNVVLPGGPTLGTMSAGKYTATPDALAIKGSGSTGDVSGMSIPLPGGNGALNLSQITQGGAYLVYPWMSTVQVNAVFAAAVSAGVKGIDFAPNSTFTITKQTTMPGTSGDAVGLLVSGSAGLTIDLHGSTLLFDGADKSSYAHALGLSNNTDLTIRNGRIDYKHLPFAQATLISKTSTSATFQQDSGYDTADRTAFTWASCQRIEGFDPQTGLYTGTILEWQGQNNGAGSGPTGIARDRAITFSGNTFTVDFSNANDTPQLATLTVGSHYLIQHQVYGADAVRMYGNTNTVFDNVQVYSAAGMGFQGYGWVGGQVAQRNVKFLNGAGVDVAPATGRVQSTNADGIHLEDFRGLIELRRAISRGSRDDAVNIYGFDTKIQSVSSATSFTIYGYRPWVMGDILSFVDPNGQGQGNSIVTAAPYQLANGQWSYTVAALPSGAAQNWIVQNVSSIGDVIVDGGRFGFNRGHGLLGGGYRWTVTNNEFADMPAAGALSLLQTFPANNEGPLPQDITFSRNRLRNVNAIVAGATQGGYGDAQVMIGSYAADGATPAPAGQIDKVVIEDNDFGATRNSDVLVFGAKTVVIDKNTHRTWANGRNTSAAFGYSAAATALTNVSDARIGIGEKYLVNGKRVLANSGTNLRVAQPSYVQNPSINGSGGTFQADDTATLGLISGSGTYATYTQGLPANPTDGDVYEFGALFNVTTLTITSPDASVNTSSLSNYVAKTRLRYRYFGPGNTWYPQA